MGSNEYVCTQCNFIFLNVNYHIPSTYMRHEIYMCVRGRCVVINFASHLFDVLVYDSNLLSVLFQPKNFPSDYFNHENNKK